MSVNSIDKLNIEIQASATKANTELDKTAKSLEKLGTALKSVTGVNISGFSSSLSSLSNATKAIKGTGDFSKFASSISALGRGFKNLNSGEISSATSSIRSLAGVMNSLEIDTSKAEALKNFGTGIKSLSNVSKNLDGIDFDKLGTDIKQLANAIKPLTDEMLRAGPAASTYGTQLKEVVQAAKAANKVKTSGAGGFYASGKTSFKLANITAAVYALKQGSEMIGGFINNTNSYIENMNLFTVAMGDFAEQGQAFAQELEIKLGIDSGEAMRYMGFFQQLSTSFGVSSEQAYVLSTNLTALGYDIASFYNLGTEEAFLKLQSGLAGKLFCLIRKGLRIVTYLNREHLAYA